MEATATPSNEPAFEKRRSSNAAHFVLLKQACRVVGRDFNVVTRFESFREEEHTIHCALALVVVCIITFLSMQSALDYILFDVVPKTVTQKTKEFLAQISTVVPILYTVIIFLLDRSILNDGRASKEREEDAKDTIFGFLRLGVFRVVFSRPTLVFRALLIAVVAVMSALFVMARLNAQLLASDATDSVTERGEEQRKESHRRVAELNKRKDSALETRRGLAAELAQTSAAGRKNDVSRLKELTELDAINRRRTIELRSRIEACADDCDALDTQRLKTQRQYQADRREILDKSGLDKRDTTERARELTEQIRDLDLLVEELDQEISGQRRSLDSSLRDLEVRRIEYINQKQSFAALIRYALDGDESGRIISLTLFAVVLTFFLVVDGSIMVLKFSRDSLYDRFMDIVDEKWTSQMKADAAAAIGASAKR